MRLSNTFNKTMNAYKDKYRFIINSGGSRSSKTYSTLQLLYIIAKNSTKKRIIHVVSYSTPHLRDGAITDFEDIIQNEGEDLEEVRLKNPYTFTIGNSIIKFIGIDRVGKALGGQKDILFINEANNMKWKVVHQLIQRTTETVFIDYNPSEKFWVETQGVNARRNAITLHSTFLDNLDNLKDSQITEFEEGKEEHDKEVEQGVEGYWYNWWRVFGLGKKGKLVGAVFNRWSVGDFPDHLDHIHGLDFGWTHPFVVIKVAFDKKNKNIHVDELIYKTKQDSDMILEGLNENVENKNKMISADCAEPTSIRDIKNDGFEIIGLSKDKIIIGIKRLQKWNIIFTPRSKNLIEEAENYVWSDTKKETPVDKFNHGFDALRYAEKYYKMKIG